MRKLAAILLGSVMLSAMIFAGSPKTVRLIWTYPADEVTPELGFVIFSSTNIAIPLTNWLVLTNAPGTSRSLVITAVPGKNYFAMKATNALGESDFSEVAIGILPRSDVNLQVTK